MAKFVFEMKKEENFDAKIFLFDKEENRIDSYIKKHLSKDELEMIDVLMKREGFPSEKKDMFVASLKSGKIIFVAYGKEDKSDLFFQKMGGKMAKALFTSKNAVFYTKNAMQAYHFAFGYELGSYRFNKYFTKKDKEFYSSLKTLSFVSEKEKLNTAYHEAGHAIVGLTVPEHDPVYKVSIIPRGRALGVTMFLPEDDR